MNRLFGLILDHDVIDASVRAVCMMQASFVIAATILVLVTYWPDRRMRHITTISLSHVLLTILVAHALTERLYLSFPWRLPMAMIAFAMSDYAILKIYRQRRIKTDKKQIR